MITEAFPTTQTTESARALIRYVRGQIGNHNRRFAVKPKAAGKAGEIPPMPPSLARPFEPYVVEGCKRVGVLSDIHVPFHCPEAVEAAVRKLRENNCDAIVLNGDICDFYAVSRHDKSPDRDFAAEIRMCIEMLQYLRACFPKAKMVFKEGNHEFRFDAYIFQRAPELFGIESLRIPEVLKLRSMRIDWVADQRPIMVGKLPILHGHELPSGPFGGGVNPSRGAFLRAVHSLLVGHSHRSSSHNEPNMFHDEIATWSTGCLCDLRPDYAKYNKWNHGFAYVDVGKDGQYSISNYRIGKDFTVRST
jgi:predicted phosphodiesterase